MINIIIFFFLSFYRVFFPPQLHQKIKQMIPDILCLEEKEMLLATLLQMSAMKMEIEIKGKIRKYFK